MSRYHSYINTAKTIIGQYKGQEPLAIYLKQFFAANKKYGGKDRKQIGSLCYDYYRVAHAMQQVDIEQQLLVATLLCEHQHSNLLQDLKPEWDEIITAPTTVKLQAIESPFEMGNLFPFLEYLSDEIDAKAFSASFFQQPLFFIRLRPGHQSVVIAKLTALAVNFIQINENCLALPNGTKLSEEIAIDKEVVVQDYNSQQVGEALRPYVDHFSRGLQVWDCCAASGGKSIMLHDLNKAIRFIVSDIRPSILHNLQNRFQRAGLQQYQSFVANLASDEAPLSVTQQFNMVLADVPCTGSGTWARTPEQLYYFKQQSIHEFVRLQQKIVGNIIPHIAAGGYLVYITCSVFKKENEDMVAHIETTHHLQLQTMQFLHGYHQKADTMFLAVFKK